MRQINDVQTIQCRGENGLHRSWTQGTIHKFDDMHKCLFNPFYFRSIFGVQTDGPRGGRTQQAVFDMKAREFVWRDYLRTNFTTALQRRSVHKSVRSFFWESFDVDIYGLYSYYNCCNTRFGLKDHAYLTYHISSKQLLPKARLMVFDIPSWSHHRAQFFGFSWTLGPMGCVRFGEGGVGQARASDHRAVVRFAEGTGSAPSYIG